MPWVSWSHCLIPTRRKASKKSFTEATSTRLVYPTPCPCKGHNHLLRSNRSLTDVTRLWSTLLNLFLLWWLKDTEQKCNLLARRLQNCEQESPTLRPYYTESDWAINFLGLCLSYLQQLSDTNFISCIFCHRLGKPQHSTFERNDTSISYYLHQAEYG